MCFPSILRNKRRSARWEKKEKKTRKIPNQLNHQNRVDYCRECGGTNSESFIQISSFFSQHPSGDIWYFYNSSAWMSPQLFPISNCCFVVQARRNCCLNWVDCWDVLTIHIFIHKFLISNKTPFCDALVRGLENKNIFAFAVFSLFILGQLYR